ncbi:MAG: hypothetical protein D4R64_07935 [Porphyromonadaceae bacterium]|nr:MAG: hypothetical protein D4R64_07935 [Porphyromonadaceae bacterium]
MQPEMRKALLIIGFISIALGVNAQKSYDYGLFMGMTEKHIHTILPIPDSNGLGYAAGGYYRYSMNARYSLRGGINAGFDKVTFTPNMVDAFGLFEFNFHPLNPKLAKKSVSSYIAVGLSYLIDIPLYQTISQTPNASIGKYMVRNIRIPFHVGVRYNATPNLTFGIEWALRKGFQQDYEIPDAPVNNFMISNWRSHVGITIGYLVSNYCKTCPFYENERKKIK